MFKWLHFNVGFLYTKRALRSCIINGKLDQKKIPGVFIICFTSPTESRRSIPAERLAHAELESAVGCDRTSGSGKGKRSFQSQKAARIVTRRKPLERNSLGSWRCAFFVHPASRLMSRLSLCLHVHPVIAAELHPGRVAFRKGGAEGQRPADLRRPAAVGVPRDHPQQHPVRQRAEHPEVRESRQSLRSKEGESCNRSFRCT